MQSPQNRYTIIYSKGYQDKDNVLGGVTMKLKGVEFYNASQEPFLQNCQGSTGAQVYDPADYVIPPQVRIRWFRQLAFQNNNYYYYYYTRPDLTHF